jgi:hypothetical protein
MSDSTHVVENMVSPDSCSQPRDGYAAPRRLCEEVFGGEGTR